MSFEAWPPQTTGVEKKEKPREVVDLGIRGERFYADTVKLTENRLDKNPSCIFIEAEDLMGRKIEMQVSRFIGSDPEAGYTKDWKTLDQFMVLPFDGEESVKFDEAA